MSNSKSLFVPPAAALKSVGLAESDLGSDDAIYELIASCTTNMRQQEARIAVATYTLWKRGATTEKMAQRMGVSQVTVQRRIAEGMAILRTGDADRSVAAVRTANLSIAQVEDATKGTGNPGAKLIRLEQGALSTAIKARYKDGSGATPDTTTFVDTLLPSLQQAAKADSVPPTMDELIHYVPNFSEDLGLEKITRTASTSTSDGPFAIAYHMKKAWEDVQALVKASDGLPYEATDADLAGLLDLLTKVPTLRELFLATMQEYKANAGKK